MTTCQYFSAFITLVSSLYSLDIWAQSVNANPPFRFNVEHFGIEEGLPNRNTLAIAQDHKGYIWLGTLNGAYQYDGNQFRALLSKKALSDKEVYTPFINRIGIDNKGYVWLGNITVNGPVCRSNYIIKSGDRESESLSVSFSESGKGVSDCIFYYINSESGRFNYVMSPSGNVYWYLGMHRFRKVARFKYWYEYSYSPPLFETEERTLLYIDLISEEQKKYLLKEIDSTGKILKKFLLNDNLRPIRKDKDGAIYLCRFYKKNNSHARNYYNGDDIIYKLSKNGKLEPISINFPSDFKNIALKDPHFYVKLNCIYDKINNLYWIEYENCILAWHPQWGIVFNSLKMKIKLNRTALNSFAQTLVDRTGVIWMATNDGIVKITPKLNLFNRFFSTNKDAIGAQPHSIRGISQLGKQLLINSNYLMFFDLDANQEDLVKSNISKDLNNWSGQCPIMNIDNNYIWSAHNGLNKYNIKTRESKSYTLNANGICTSILPVNNRWLWLGHHYGISRFNLEKEKVFHYNLYNQFDELSRNIVNGFFPDQRAGGIWVPASSGLYLLDTLKGVIARYSTREKFPDFLPFDHITFVHPDPINKPVYWLGTLGGGLICWNRKTGDYKQYTTKDGLSDNTIYAIYEDKLGRLWLPSNKGLMSFQKDTHQLSIYHVSDGIADDEFNLFSHYQAPDGRLFLGGINGITAFYPDQIPVDTEVKSPLLLTVFQKLDMNTGNMVDYTSEYKETNQIHLTSGDRLFSLTFTLLDFRYLNDFRLWYRIEGWQDRWVMQNSKEIRINGLPSGNYTVQVRAQINNGKWVTKHVNIPVNVDAPFYFRVWFILLCVVLFVSLGVLLSRIRNQQLRKDKELLEYEVSVRTAKIAKDKALIEQQANQLRVNALLKSRFLANVSHEFRTPLTLIIGPIKYIAQKLTDSPSLQLLAAMERNAEQLLMLVNDLLSLSKTDIQQLTLNEQPADLALLVKHIVIDSFLPQAQYAGVDLQVTGVEEPCLMLVDADKLLTVLRNLISNALRFTQKGGCIKVHLSQDDNTATIEVRDTGMGIHPDDLPHIFERYFQTNQLDKALQGGTGIGLAICQEYCLLWGGTISVDSQLGEGSTFLIGYPKRSFVPANDVLVQIDSLSLNTKTSHMTLRGSYSSLMENDDSSEQRLSLLLVDDNPDVLLYLKTILSPSFGLIFAQNGSEALTLLQSPPNGIVPDLIITDIMMPETDGLTFLKAIVASEDYKHIPVLMLTARADLDSRLQALQLGVADYLTKPFQAEELLIRIQNLIRRSDNQQFSNSQQSNQVIDHETEKRSSWIRELQEIIRQNLTNESFSVYVLADMVNLGERNFQRRLKAYTGMTPTQFINEVRLQVAYELFQQEPHLQVKQVAYAVGYQKASYFTKLYRDRFGVYPSAAM